MLQTWSWVGVEFDRSMDHFATPRKHNGAIAQMTGASPRVLVRQRGGAECYPAVGLRSSQLRLTYSTGAIAYYCLLQVVYKQLYARKIS